MQIDVAHLPALGRRAAPFAHEATIIDPKLETIVPTSSEDLQRLPAVAHGAPTWRIKRRTRLTAATCWTSSPAIAG